MRHSVHPPLAELVERALVALLRESRANAPGPASTGGAWRLAALLEGVERSQTESDYALSPRSTRGATRA